MLHYLGYALLFTLLGGSGQHVSTSSPNARMPTSPRKSDPGAPPDPTQIPGNRAAASSVESQATAIAVFSANFEGEITTCNSALAEMSGRSFQQLQGRNFSTLFSQDGPSSRQDQSQLQKAIRSAAGNASGYQANLFLQTSAGNRVRVKFSGTLMRDAASQPVALVVVAAPILEPAADSVIPASRADSAGESPVGPGVVARKIDDIQFILASPVMHRFIGLVDRVAGHTETALVTGETGTGKELIARTIHESLPRRGRPWVDINC